MTRPPHRSRLDSIHDFGDQTTERASMPPEHDYRVVHEKLSQILVKHPYWGKKLKEVLEKVMEQHILSPDEIMAVLNRQEPLGALVHFENVLINIQQRRSSPSLSQEEIPPARPSSPSIPAADPYVGAIRGGSGQLGGLHQRVRTLLGGALADPNKPLNNTPSIPPDSSQSRKTQK